MGDTAGIWPDDVSCYQCLYQGGTVSGIASGQRVQVAEGGGDDIGDGEVDYNFT